jgi:hypothetical protein
MSPITPYFGTFHFVFNDIFMLFVGTYAYFLLVVFSFVYLNKLTRIVITQSYINIDYYNSATTVCDVWLSADYSATSQGSLKQSCSQWQPAQSIRPTYGSHGPVSFRLHFPPSVLPLILPLFLCTLPLAISVILIFRFIISITGRFSVVRATKCTIYNY